MLPTVFHCNSYLTTPSYMGIIYMFILQETEDGETDQRETILELQDFIDTLKEKISSAQNQSTEPDPDWMTGTNINIPQVHNIQCAMCLFYLPYIKVKKLHDTMKKTIYYRGITFCKTVGKCINQF